MMKVHLDEFQILLLKSLSNGLEYDQIAEMNGHDVAQVKQVSMGTREALRAKTDEHLVAIALKHKYIT